MLDRNGEYLVQSRGCYDMMITYRELSPQGFDTLKVCEVLDITKERLLHVLKMHERPRLPTLLVNYISMRDKLRFDELGVEGFSNVYRTARSTRARLGATC